jgi:hypothetical protein
VDEFLISLARDPDLLNSLLSKLGGDFATFVNSPDFALACNVSHAKITTRHSQSFLPFSLLLLLLLLPTTTTYTHHATHLPIHHSMAAFF